MLLYGIESAQSSSFKLCQSEVESTVQLEPDAQHVPGALLKVGYDRASGIVWRVDPQSGSLKTVENSLCVHQHRGSSSIVLLFLSVERTFLLTEPSPA